jgi:hypothetical protein
MITFRRNHRIETILKALEKKQSPLPQILLFD